MFVASILGIWEETASAMFSNHKYSYGLHLCTPIWLNPSDRVTYLLMCIKIAIFCPPTLLIFILSIINQCRTLRKTGNTHTHTQTQTQSCQFLFIFYLFIWHFSRSLSMAQQWLIGGLLASVGFAVVSVSLGRFSSVSGCVPPPPPPPSAACDDAFGLGRKPLTTQR